MFFFLFSMMTEYSLGAGKSYVADLIKVSRNREGGIDCDIFLLE